MPEDGSSRETNDPVASGDPQRLGPYGIVRLLGRGGMGDVFLAVDARTSERVALKILPRTLAFRPRRIQRFLAEARASGSIDHPAIAGVYESGEIDGVHFIALDYVDGLSLSEVLQRRTLRGSRPLAELLQPLLPDPLPPETRGPAQAVYLRDIAQLIERVARGLHRAHELGILHRDVKPSNILVHLDGRPRLADFGLARIEGGIPVTLTGEFVGTADYASPEQADPLHSSSGPASDVFSLGATLFECVTGRPPFGSGIPFEVLRRIRTTAPCDPRTLDRAIPEALSRIVSQCLEKPLARRYASAGDLADDLARFRAGEPVLARAIPKPLRAWRRASANRWRLLLAASGAATALGIGALAISAIRSAHVEARHDAAAKRGRAGDLLASGQIFEALEHLDDAVRADRANPLGLALRGVALVAQDRLDDGARDIRAALERGLDSRFGLALEGPTPAFLDPVMPAEATFALEYLLGRRHLLEHRPERALECFRRSDTHDHPFPDARAGSSTAHSLMGRFAGALEAAESYRDALRPVAPEYRLARALVAQARGDFDEAIRAIDEVPDAERTPLALRLRAECAIEEFDAARERDSGAPLATRLLRAVDDLRRARVVNPHDVRVQLDLAGALARLALTAEDFEAQREASGLVESLLSSDPGSAGAHGIAGLLAERRDPARAIAELARACELEPYDPRWKNAHAQALLRGGAVADAARECERLVAGLADPGDRTAKRLEPFGGTVATTAAAMGDRDAGIALLERALARVPTSRVDRQLGLLLAAREKTAFPENRANADAAARRLLAARERGDDDPRAAVALLYLLTKRGAAGARPFGVVVPSLARRCRDLGPPDLSPAESLDLAWGLLRSGLVDAKAAAFGALRRAHLDEPARVPDLLRDDVAIFVAEWRR